MKPRYEYRDAYGYTVARVQEGWQEVVNEACEMWVLIKHPASIVRWVIDTWREFWRAVGKW